MPSGRRGEPFHNELQPREYACRTGRGGVASMRRIALIAALLLAGALVCPGPAAADVHITVYVAAGGVTAGVSILLFLSFRAAGLVETGEDLLGDALLAHDGSGWHARLPLPRAGGAPGGEGTASVDFFRISF